MQMRTAIIISAAGISVPLLVNFLHRPDPDYYYLGNLVLGALGVFVLLECALAFVARYLSPEDASVP